MHKFQTVFVHDQSWFQWENLFISYLNQTPQHSAWNSLTGPRTTPRSAEIKNSKTGVSRDLLFDVNLDKRRNPPEVVIKANWNNIFKAPSTWPWVLNTQYKHEESRVSVHPNWCSVLNTMISPPPTSVGQKRWLPFSATALAGLPGLKKSSNKIKGGKFD